MSKVSRAKLAAFARDVAEYTERSVGYAGNWGLCDRARFVSSSPQYARDHYLLGAYHTALDAFYARCVSTFLWSAGDPARIIGGYLLAEVLESEAADEEAS